MNKPLYEIRMNNLDTSAPDWMAGILRGDKRYCVRGQDITDWITWVSPYDYPDDEDEFHYVVAICHERDGKQTIINFNRNNIIKETDTTIYLDSPTPDEIIAEVEQARQQSEADDLI
jgi:hypothetical protein